MYLTTLFFTCPKQILHLQNHFVTPSSLLSLTNSNPNILTITDVIDYITLLMLPNVILVLLTTLLYLCLLYPLLHCSPLTNSNPKNFPPALFTHPSLINLSPLPSYPQIERLIYQVSSSSGRPSLLTEAQHPGLPLIKVNVLRANH
jgi:hypothetical protein